MKCIRCGEETSNAQPYGSGGLCNGLPILGTAEHDAALAACMARRDAADAAVRAAHVAQMLPKIERVYNGLPLALVVVEPVPGDTITWADDVGKIAGDCSDITAAFPSGLVQLRESATCDGLFLSQSGGERDGYALWLDTPEKRPGERSWSIKYLDRRTPQVVAVDVVSTITVRGAS